MATTITQKHVKHRTWYTCITVGEGKKARQFGLRRIPNGFRVYAPFGGTSHQDFPTQEEAIAHCESQ
jgi:hypothetical protein